MKQSEAQKISTSENTNTSIDPPEVTKNCIEIELERNMDLENGLNKVSISDETDEIISSETSVGG